MRPPILWIAVGFGAGLGAGLAALPALWPAAVLGVGGAWCARRGTKEGKKKKGKEKKEEPPPEDYEKELEGDQLSYVSNMPELPKPISIQ